jgi:hypothetical protein
MNERVNLLEEVLEGNSLWLHLGHEVKFTPLCNLEERWLEILAALIVKITMFWNLTPLRMVDW